MLGKALLRATGASAALLLLPVGGIASAEPVSDAWLQAQVDEIRAEYKLVALGAGVLEVGEEPVLAVAGVEAAGSSTPVDTDGAWHIGSNTKALTALLYARLVEDGKAEWGASVADLFAGIVETIDPAWETVTIEDLFAHRSGVGQIGPLWLVARHSDEKPLVDQRLNTAVERLAKAPPATPGEFEYSNLNYILAGAAIEAITGTSWEDAMADWIMEPVGVDDNEGWGFGPPQVGPVGHGTVFGFKVAQGRGSGADNPQALGPAGTMHLSIPVHLRLLAEFVDDESSLVSPDMREHLLTPWPDPDADYAMGWGVVERAGLGTTHVHRGSNTMWLSQAELIPSEKTVVVINTNQFTDGSRDAVGELAGRIEYRLSSGDDEVSAP